MSEPSKEILQATLQELRISSFPSDLEVIASASPDLEKNREVYSVVNKTLSELLDKKKISDSFHVTGEMNALADPLHRQVCRKQFKKYDTKFKMAAHLPEEFRTDGCKFLTRLQHNWQKSGWKDYLDAIYLVGRGEIDLFAQDDIDPIHYSVFDDDWVLLQSRHDHLQHEKNVWFIHSPKLNNELKLRATQSVKKAQKVHPKFCRDFYESINSALALDILYTLEEKEIEKGKFEEKFSKDSNHAKIKQNLQEIKFIESGDTVKISSFGNEYLELFN